MTSTTAWGIRERSAFTASKTSKWSVPGQFDVSQQGVTTGALFECLGDVNEPFGQPLDLGWRDPVEHLLVDGVHTVLGAIQGCAAMLMSRGGHRMASITGPDFIALQTRDLARSPAFSVEQLGLKALPSSSPGAVVFDTKPIPFAIREPLVDLDASPRLGWGVSLWLAADDAQTLHDRLVEAGTLITRAPTPGPFGLQFSFLDPDGYPVTVHQPT